MAKQELIPIVGRRYASTPPDSPISVIFAVDGPAAEPWDGLRISATEGSRRRRGMAFSGGESSTRVAWSRHPLWGRGSG